MYKKYGLISDSSGMKRLLAYRDMPEIGVKAGDHGGLVSGEHNLSHEGLCWIYPGASVGDNALVIGNATVQDSASLRNRSVARDDAVVRDSAMLRGRSSARGTAVVCGSARLYDDVVVCADASVGGSAWLFGGIVVGDAATLTNGLHGARRRAPAGCEDA